ncbi:hypothetical protein PIB30_053070 [Stylosanthes scabra]|uniref:RRM domain-containing protein n=1 Tax=Stylosanthes scabra TaxID=79078 RepID=A0ABU6XJK0_9FABA|nr:hypothetical protein [Stylosanthes scabra]
MKGGNKEETYSSLAAGQGLPYPQSWKSQFMRNSGHKGEPVRGKWIEDETFNIFVDNLPVDMIKEWLWNVFGRSGKVVDIYISRKIRKANPLRFAFIRYKFKDEALRTIDHLDGWIVWGCRLRLTEARYRRRDRDKAGANNKN